MEAHPRLWIVAVLAACSSLACAADRERSQAAMLRDPRVGIDVATADAIGGALRRENFSLKFLSAEDVCDPAALSAGKYSLLVIPNATNYPAAGAGVLARFLHEKGSLLVVGANPFTSGPLIETLSPAYKTYPLKDIASLRVDPAQTVVEDAAQKLPAPEAAWSCYARPEGKGLERGYAWRWIPLVRAFDKDGAERGTAAWLLRYHAPLSEGPDFEDAVARLAGTNVVQSLRPGDGAMVAVCAVADNASLREIARTSLLGDMARRIRDGVFLSNAGADQFSYWPGEKVRLGAVIASRGTGADPLTVRIRVTAEGARDPVFEDCAKIAFAPGAQAAASFEWAPDCFASALYAVTTELLREGKRLDLIEHEIGVLSEEKAARDAFVTVKGGDFWLEGRKWYPVGVNYWPRYAIALECEDYVFHWLTPGFYNPGEIEKDLALLESMGANFVSIRAHHQNDRRTLLDFLRRCRNHGIRVMVFAQTHVVTDDPHYFQGVMMPFHFQQEAAAEFIRSARLAENPTLMGWDLIWEPAGWVFSDNMRAFGWKEPNYRKRWDADWATWIDERYGTLAAAEADWGVPAPRQEGRVTGPPAKQFSEDGPWRILVAAYRRFMDDLMSRKWNDATRALRALDPNHLVTFRQGNLPPIDFTITATPKHVDFFAMEGYGFKPDDTGPDAAGFVSRYIHFMTKGKPCVWVEFGASAWDRVTMQATAAAIASQAQNHELIYRAALKTGASGASPWWFAGGYRVSEKSDFGILNPDGTLRPSGELLKRYAALFKAPRTCPEEDAWFTMDRDAHSGGHWRVAYNDGARAFKEADAHGRSLGVRTSGTGTTSADTPLLAVGNTKYNGRNPPKYLDAEFNGFRIKAGEGGWIDVHNGARIRVPRNTPLRAAASVGNLQEASWLAPARCAGRQGAVFLASTEGSALKFKAPIAKDTAWQEDAEIGESVLLSDGVASEARVELQMMAEGRAWFGEKLRFTLEPDGVVPGRR